MFIKLNNININKKINQNKKLIEKLESIQIKSKKIMEKAKL